MNRKILRTMSTQHPGNATLPIWASGNVIQGDAEVDEANFAYNDLGCMEVMWDSEGKDVDTRVVRKLLEKYGEFFKRDLFGYSRSVGKVSLPRAIPFAGALYTLGIPPEFIGLGALSELSEAEWDALKKHYENFGHDLESVAGFISWRNLNMLADMYPLVAKMVNIEEDKLRSAISNILTDLNIVEENFSLKLGPKSLSQRKYENVINDFLIAFLEKDHKEAENRLLEAAKIRKCLG